jgi:hypothetical protein
LQDVTDERGLQLAVLPFDVLGEPDFAFAQFVKLGLDLLQFFDDGELDERFGLLGRVAGHIHLGRVGF